MSFALDRPRPQSGQTLVLGGTGLIGVHVVETLRARGNPVRVVTRDLAPTNPLARGAVEHLRLLGAELLEGDIADRVTLDAALEGCVRVVHSAAPYPTSHWRADAQVSRATRSVEAFLSAIEPAWKSGRLHSVVFVSSATTIGAAPRDRMGRPSRIANESDRFDPSSERAPYFLMKWAMEERVLAEAGAGAPIVVVNPALVVGARDAALTTGRLLLPLAKGLMQAYLPGIVPTVAACDVGEAIVEALASGQLGTRYILATENLEARELLSIAAREAAVTAPRFALPLALAEAIAGASELANLLLRRNWPLVPLSGVRMARHAQALDASRARSELHLRGTPVGDALREAFAWYRAEGLI